MHAHDTATRRLGWVFGATLVLFAVEALAALYTRSMALTADSAHMLADMVALGLALGARWVARRPVNARHTFGYARFELFSAAANAVLLAVLSIGVAITAIRHFASPPVQHESALLVVAAAGLLVNVGSFFALRHDASDDLNIRAALAEVFADGLGSVMVLVSAAVIAWTGWTRIDPLASLAIAFLMLPRAVQLGREAVHLLADGVPPRVDVARVASSLQRLDGVADIHDLHIWSLGASRVAASAHLLLDGTRISTDVLRDATAVVTALTIEHPTFQIELPGTNCAAIGCCAAPPLATLSPPLDRRKP